MTVLSGLRQPEGEPVGVELLRNGWLSRSPILLGPSAMDARTPAEDWRVDQIVRAEDILAVIREPTPPGPETPALHLVGARVTGRLDLSEWRLHASLRFRDCRFDEPVTLSGTTIQSLTMHGCYGHSLNLGDARIAGNLAVNRSSMHSIYLVRTYVKGNLSLDATELRSFVQKSLAGQHLRVGGNMLCGADGRTQFSAAGMVDLVDARIGGSLSMSGARVGSLTAWRMRVGGVVECTPRVLSDGRTAAFTAAGTVDIASATIGGGLRMGGAELKGKPNSLNAPGLVVGTDVHCDTWSSQEPPEAHARFSAAGTVSLWGARIGGSLSMNGATLTAESGPALDATRIEIGDGLYCGRWVGREPGRSEQFFASGGIKLDFARVAGGINMHDAHLHTDPSRSEYALSANGIHIGRNLQLGGVPNRPEPERLTIDGSVSLNDAVIGGSVFIIGARIVGSVNLPREPIGLAQQHAGTVAVEAARISVSGSVLLSATYRAGRMVPAEVLGYVFVNGAIGESLTILGSRITARREGVALNAVGLKVGKIVIHPYIGPQPLSVLRSRIIGQLSIPGVDVSGDVALDAAIVNTPHGASTPLGALVVGTAVQATRARVGGSVFVSDLYGVSPIVGGICLNSSRLGALMIAAGVYTDGSVKAVNLVDATVEGHLLLAPGVRVSAEPPETGDGRPAPGQHAGRDSRPEIVGGVDLSGAHVASDVFIGGRFRNHRSGDRSSPAEACLTAVSARVDGDLVLGDEDVDGFTFDTAVDLKGARVAGALNVRLAAYEKPERRDPGVPHDTDGAIVLADAKVATLDLPTRPDKRGSGSARVVIDGLVYDAFASDQSVRSRLAWLSTSLGKVYRPQPYEQLAAHYRGAGEDHAARRVLNVKMRAQSRSARGVRRLWAWPVGAVQDLLTGYGYRPGRAILWLLIGLVAGFVVFTEHPVPGIGPRHDMTALLTVDILVPTSPFGLEASVPRTGVVYWTAVGLQALGWVLSIAALAVVTRTLSRERG